MRSLLTSALLVVCVVSALGSKVQAPKRATSFSSQQAQPRDGGFSGGPHGGGGGHIGGGGGHIGGGGGHIGGGGHGSSFSHISHDDGHFGGGGDPYKPPTSYVEEPAKDTGFYYYYYPVVPDNGGSKKSGLFSSSKGFFGKMMETIMYPFLYPLMRAYDYFEGRALTARAADYLPMQLFDKIAKMIEEEIYKEECLSRMICQLGKSAEGYETFVHLGDFFVAEEYQDHLRTFKDSVLKKQNCSLKYKCTSLDPATKL